MNVRNFVWLIAGIILIGTFVVATTTITDNSIVTTGGITANGQMLFTDKVDIGQPGVGGGLDVGEGGSYTKNITGDVIVQAFSYDASASSGSRFTELTLDATNTLLNDSADRLYVGSEIKFWAIRFAISTAKSTEIYNMSYYNGSDMVIEHYMGFLKNNATTVGTTILNQTKEQEYVIWDHSIDSSWIPADDVTDVIPNGARDMYWVAIEVPQGNLATAPVITDIKVRGTDFDIVSGASYPLFWGNARIEKHAPIQLSVQKVPGGVTTTAIDINAAHQQTVFNFDGAGDAISFFWTLPEAIDTSSDLEVTMDYAANAADTYELNLSGTKLTEATPIGSAVVPDFETPVSIVAAAASTIYHAVTIGEGINIQNMSIGDSISFGLERTDGSNAIYPISITLHYVVYSTGDHV